MRDLVHKLRDEAARLSGYSLDFGNVDAGLASNIADAAADEIERLRAALENARDGLRNDFEPDNQSAAWHRANNALRDARKA